MKYYFLIFFFALGHFDINAQNDDCQQYTDESLSPMAVFLINIRDSIVPVIGKGGIIGLKKESFSETGSGILLKKNNQIFLLTAKHVASTMKDSSRFIISVDDKRYPFSFKESASKKGWVYHPKVDIAIIRITASSDLLTKYSFPWEQVLIDSLPISSDISVLALGYPLYDILLDKPVLMDLKSNFFSTLINHQNLYSKINAFYVLKQPSIQGLSGGPVFIGAISNGMNIGPKCTILLGIMSATRSDNTGGKLGLITPTFYIKEIIDKAK